jgi:hypothetical protein
MGRVQKIATNTILNGFVAESTLNFLRRDYAFTRLELVDKDELFPQATVHPAYRIGAYTFGGVRDLVQTRAWQLGLGGDVIFYSKPVVLDAAYGVHPVSFQIFLRRGWRGMRTSTCEVKAFFWTARTRKVLICSRRYYLPEVISCRSMDRKN